MSARTRLAANVHWCRGATSARSLHARTSVQMCTHVVLKCAAMIQMKPSGSRYEVLRMQLLTAQPCIQPDIPYIQSCCTIEVVAAMRTTHTREQVWGCKRGLLLTWSHPYSLRNHLLSKITPRFACLTKTTHRDGGKAWRQMFWKSLTWHHALHYSTPHRKGSR